MIPAFDQVVPRDGYAWWYLDAISADQRYGLTLIAFVGSVFSPYYAWARARGRGDPMAHCAINVALYGPKGRWSMTERSARAVTREATMFTVGPSALRWDGNALRIDLHEWAFPLLRPLRGHIRVWPEIVHNQPLQLDERGLHQWTATWPAARVELALQRPDLNWSGEAYFDHNSGSEPLEQGFQHWTWSRAMTRRGPLVLYDTTQRSGLSKAHAIRFDRSGEREHLPSPTPVQLPHTFWRIKRSTRSENGQSQVISTWEDTPFYARSLISTHLVDEPVTAVHESLSLDRFSKPLVQLMLPFRMPRRSGWN